MAATGKLDWTAVETEYITGKDSLRELAKRHGVVLSTVGRHASAGEWESKRQAYRLEAQAKCKQEMSPVMEAILDKVQFDALCERNCDIAVAHCANVLTWAFNNRASLLAEELDKILGAIKKAQDIKYRALNVPLPKQTVEHSGSVNIVSDAVQEAERIRAQREQWKQQEARA